MIDDAPEVHPPACDAHHHLVEVPAIARACALASKVSRDDRAELQDPAPHRFIGQVETTLGQELLDVAAAQGEPQIQPDRVLDDSGRKAMTAIGERSHLATLPHRRSYRDNAEVS